MGAASFLVVSSGSVFGSATEFSVARFSVSGGGSTSDSSGTTTNSIGLLSTSSSVIGER